VTSPLSVDEHTLVQFVTAADQTLADCRAAQMSVTSAQEYLSRTWGGVASNQYNTSLGQWLDGLNRVTTALQSIQSNVSTYRQQTGTTENDAASDAHWIPGGSSWT
jgi:WXG100 family type VII secretion target